MKVSKEKLKVVRESYEYSQADVVHLLKENHGISMSVAQYSMIETNRRIGRVETLFAISDVLNVPFVELFPIVKINKKLEVVEKS